MSRIFISRIFSVRLGGAPAKNELVYSKCHITLLLARYCKYIRNAELSQNYHMLNGSSSLVLTAT